MKNYGIVFKLFFLAIVFLASFSLVCIFPTTVLAFDYYFSNSTGNDTTGDGSISSPWQTISKINSTVYLPGDNIFLKAGDSWIIGSGEPGIGIDFDGNASNPIIISSYGLGNKPIIDASGQIGDGIRGNNSIEVCIFFSGYGIFGNYVFIDSLDLRAAGNEYAVDAYNGTQGFTKLRNCQISGSGWSAEGLVRFDGDYNEISNNIFSGGNFSYSKAIEISNSDNCLISSNDLSNHASSGGAIRIVHSNYCIIEKNYIHGVSNGQTDHWGIVVRDANIPLSWNVVRNNIVDLHLSNLSGDHVFGLNTWNATGDHSSAVEIYYNNFIGNNAGSALKIQSSDNTSVVGNILYNFNFYIEVDNSCGTGAVKFHHNNYYSCTGGSDIELLSTYVDSGSNIVSNPMFVSDDFLSNNDFKISSTSPCIGSGAVVTRGPSDDYWNELRDDGQIDIGVHEYKDSESDITPPSSPTGLSVN